MKIKLNFSPLKIAKYMLWIMAFLALLNLGVQIAKYHFHYRQEWMVIFNMDRELNFPTLYSVILLLIPAYLLKKISILKKSENSLYTKYWKTLSYIFLFLAADE